MHIGDRARNSSVLRRSLVPLLSILGTFFFFHEYFVRRVYIPFDLPSFHDPLADYAFMALRHGRFPEWDPTDYSGMPFAANPQVALFYPGTWIMFLGNWHRQHLSYWTLEVFVLAHIWIAWMLSFVWMRRRLSAFASVCGASIFALGGYLPMSLQHLGVIVACAWIPLGLMGIDEASDTRSWRPLWKVIAASALAFLGGYTPTWFVAAVCLLSYSLFRRGGWRVGLQTAAALGASLAVAMVQLLPATRLTALRVPEARYGLGIRDPAYYISCLIPNFYDFGPRVNALKNYGQEYLYIGVPAIVGLTLLAFYRKPKDVPGEALQDGAQAGSPWSAVSLAAMFATCAVILTNPFSLVSNIVFRSTLLAQVCRDRYFLPGVLAAAAPLAAIGIDRFLARAAKPAPESRTRWATILTIAGLAAFSARLLYIWKYSWTKTDFAPGWAGAWDVGILTLLFLAGLWLLRPGHIPGSPRGPLRCALAAALLLTIGIDYKVHATSKRFNASLEHAWRTDWMPGMNADTFRELEANSVYRISVDETGPLSTDLRHFGLTTPQGFDPFITSAYRDFIQTTAHFLTNWAFAVDPANQRGIQILGLGYFISADQGPQLPALQSNPRLRRLEPNDSFYKVFEVLDKRPPYGFEQNDADAPVERTLWLPEHRAFTVRTSAPAVFHLSEQWNPGWTARIDGHPVDISRWNVAFQSINVPAGEHRIDFEFKDRGLRAGAAISLVALLGLFALFKPALFKRDVLKRALFKRPA